MTLRTRKAKPPSAAKEAVGLGVAITAFVAFFGTWLALALAVPVAAIVFILWMVGCVG